MGRVAARVAGVPIVVNTVHGYYALPEDPLTRRLPVLGLERLAARFSDLELFQSAEDLAWARRTGIVRRDQGKLLGNGTDLTTFEPGGVGERAAALRDELGIPRDSIVVGTVGRMVREKGYGEFFSAARTVQEAEPDVRFVAVGPEDPVKADALDDESLAREAGTVTFAGWRTDMPDVFAMMDVFVLASWREGLPGRPSRRRQWESPSCVTDIRGCREVVREGVEGFLVPRRDPKRLADAILRLVRDADLRKAMGDRARRRSVAAFDERRVAGDIVREYRRLLARQHRGEQWLDQEGLRSVMIRPARIEDISAIVRLHLQVIPDTAFLPVLGEGFLWQLFKAHIEDPNSVAVVAEREAEVIGYSTGVLSMRSFRRRFLARHGLAASIAAAPQLVRPRVFRKVLETTRYPEMTKGLPDAEWNFIGVKRGTAPGLGIELGRSVIERLAAKGVQVVKGYVACDNRVMNSMVRRMGFQRVGEVALHDGLPCNVYVLRCKADRSAQSRAVPETPANGQGTELLREHPW